MDMSAPADHTGPQATAVTPASEVVGDSGIMNNSGGMDESGTPHPLSIVRAFANTIDVDDGTDELASPEALGRWFADSELYPGPKPPLLDDHDRQRVVSVRSAVRDLLAANHERAMNPDGEPSTGEAYEILQRESERCPLRVEWHPSGETELVPAAALTPLDTAIGWLLVIVHDAIRDGTWARLRLCREDTCQWAFYDTSRNRSGKWCGSGCANRANVRAYRRRQRRED
jgi:predicted RNA-binding Zn ribbon-like protein